MTDKEIFAAAYADQLKKLYAALFAGLASGEDAAFDRFKSGVLLAKEALTLAINAVDS